MTEKPVELMRHLIRILSTRGRIGVRPVRGFRGDRSHGAHRGARLQGSGNRRRYGGPRGGADRAGGSVNELPAPDWLEKAWEALREIHEEYPMVHDVTIPRVERYNERQKAMWLAMLFLNRHREVHKDEMSALARRDMPKLGADQQVRHLKRDGWALSRERGRHRLDPFASSPEFVRQSARRRSRLSAEDFERLKKAFGGRCATCGAREGRPDPRYGGNPVVLQTGHKNPADAGDDPDNILPQCQFCNRGYKDDHTPAVPRAPKLRKGDARCRTETNNRQRARSAALSGYGHAS